MSYTIPEVAKKLKPYTPITESYKIRLDANESCFTLSDTLLKKIEQNLFKIEFNRYPDPYATELISAFCNWIGEGMASEFVVAGNGSDELISLLFTLFVKEDESVVCTTPDFSMYRFYAELNGVNVVQVKKRSDYTTDIDELICAVKNSGARMVILSTPCNPTGMSIERDDILKIINLVGDCLVVIDEAYMDFCDLKEYGSKNLSIQKSSIISDAVKYDNVIVLKTMSKLLGAASIRCGFAITNFTLANILRAAKSPYNLNAFTQKIATLVLSERKEIADHAKKILSCREILYGGLKKLSKTHTNMNVIPSDANFIYVEMENADKIKDLLTKRSISVRSFGNALRITVGREDEVEIFLLELEKILCEVQ